MNVKESDVSAEMVARLDAQLVRAVQRLTETRSFAKAIRRTQVLDLARRLLSLPGGIDVLYRRAAGLDAAGVFTATDWARPEVLQPALTVNSLRLGDRQTVVIECLSEIRLLAIARGDFFHPSIAAEQARHLLAQTLALNLDLLFDQVSEADRVRQGAMTEAVRGLLHYLVEHIGYENILDRLIDEIWRILAQRPIQTGSIKVMITRIAISLQHPEVAASGAGRGADRLISALYGPTKGSREDPGLSVYGQRLARMDDTQLQQEAAGFARAMHDTGLVSPYHTVYLRHVNRRNDLITITLGLSSTGRDVLVCYQTLIHELIEEAIFPETSQAVYGLALLLERGVLYQPPAAPALWRQIALPLSPATERLLAGVYGDARPARVFLLAGVLNVLGQPLGIGQGDNPTCQAARALSMWSYNDPDYLLQMVVWAARDDEIVIHFEGKPFSSRELANRSALSPPHDVDAVSLVVVPHLDIIYREMGRICAKRGEDPHRWINPEFHGWWVGRGFRIAVDVTTGRLQDYEGFVRHFYGSYHPYYNGDQPMIHPQPAGLAITDSAARFVGWHAISILRVMLDHEGVMRVYFYNPNNDSGQDWGQNIKVSTEGHGERAGESSLAIAEFASRLYIFHHDPLERGHPTHVPGDEIQRVMQLGRSSWAADR